MIPQAEYDDAMKVLWYARSYLEQVMSLPADEPVPTALRDQIERFLGPHFTMGE